ncbi:MAG: MFS transporter [Anaerovoracaceae bacterium]|nr:MFS transporter [Anaerovoracaceae bacterium]
MQNSYKEGPDTEKTAETTRSLTVSILSLSLLTVMAGAAVAPALGVIEKYFAGENRLLVQMIISVPALFIFITNLLFPLMCRHIKSKPLVMAGLALYIIGGCAAGLFSSIYAVLAARAVVGIGVGIIMPLSTGLISYYFPRGRQEEMMGWSSAMNQLGGVTATLIAGALASVSWRLSFLVYLMGLISCVLCAAFLPSDMIGEAEREDRDPGQSGSGPASQSPAKAYARYIAAMFFLMLTFFIYPSNFAIETTADGIIPQALISVIMAAMDLVAFCGGLSFVRIKARIGGASRLCAPLMFFTGYALMAFAGGWAGTLAGSFLVGFANGLGIPYIISAASQKAGRAAAATAIPLISAALYLAQFVTPAISSAVSALFTAAGLPHPAYITAMLSALIFLIISLPDDERREIR